MVNRLWEEDRSPRAGIVTNEEIQELASLIEHVSVRLAHQLAGKEDFERAADLKRRSKDFVARFIHYFETLED